MFKVFSPGFDATVNSLFHIFDNLNEAVTSQCYQSNLKIIAHSNYKFK
jgi:hypothetical protein